MFEAIDAHKVTEPQAGDQKEIQLLLLIEKELVRAP